MNWDEISKHLKAPLDPAAIKPPPQGKYGEYVDGLHVIREANRIFGFGGWSYRITRLEMVSRVTTAKPQIRVGYMATVVVTVDGVEREGSAVGSGMVGPDNEADAHESAIKEAETDAMKRALRSFGNTFGLALYDKDKSNREVASPPKPPMTDEAKRDAMKVAIKKTTNAEALDAMWKSDRVTAGIGSLPVEMQGELAVAYTDRMAEVAE
jgi:DNA repair and recombination protein RAD52